MTEVVLPGGSVVEVPASVLDVEGITIHQNKAPALTIERWHKEHFLALQATYTPEIQEVENALWEIWISRFIDYAQGEQLNMLGRLVGEGRNGRNDPNYRVRIRARIAINESLGRPQDVIKILRLLDPATAILVEFGPAAFRIDFQAPLTGLATGVEIASIVSEARAAGVGASVVMPTAADVFRFGDVNDPLRRFGIVAHTQHDILGAGTLFVPFDANPVAGSRLFLEVAQETAGAITTPTGWTLVADRTSTTLRHHVFTKTAVGNEDAMLGTIAVPASASGGRSIGRIYEVRAPALAVGTPQPYEGTGTSITGPTFTASPFWALAFVAFDSGGTISPFTAGASAWFEAAAEAVAGSAAGGIGVSLQWVGKDTGSVTNSYAATLSDTGLWSVIPHTIGPRTTGYLGTSADFDAGSPVLNGSKLADRRRA